MDFSLPLRLHTEETLDLIQALKSELDAIPGIGKKRKAILLQHFKSVKKIREASIDQLNALPRIPTATAEAIHQYFHGSEDRGQKTENR